MASPEFGKKAACAAQALGAQRGPPKSPRRVISDVQAQFEPDEFRQLVRLLGTLGDMSPTGGVELSS